MRGGHCAFGFFQGTQSLNFFYDIIISLGVNLRYVRI